MSNKFYSEILIQKQGSPQTPASGMLAIFAKSDGLYFKRDDNTEVGPLSAATLQNAPSNMVTTDTAQTISSVKTFTVAPTVPDGSFTISKVNGLQTALDAKYSASNPPPVVAPSNMVTTDTTQTVSGGKNFTGALTKNGSSVVITTDTRLSDARTPLTHTHPVTDLAVSGTANVNTFLRGDGAWMVPPTPDLSTYYSSSNPQPAPSNMVTIDTAQTLTGTKTFSLAPLVPDSSFTIAKTTGLQSALDNKYSRTNPTWVSRNKTALRNWVQSLSTANTAAADLYVIGDSIGEGYFASTSENRWVNLVRERLQRGYNPASIPGGEGFVNPHVSDMNAALDRWTFAGTVSRPISGSDVNGFGLGARYAILDAAGESGTLSFYGTQVHIFFTTGPSAGNATISIDGGTPITYNTYATTVQSGKFWSSAVLPRGQHTVTVAWGSAAVILDGALVCDGDSGAGVRLWDGSHSGFTAGAMQVSQRWTDYIKQGAVLADLCIVSFGPNEITNGITAATFETNMTALVSRIRANNATTSILVQVGARRGNTTDVIWQDYIDAAERVALASGSGFLNLAEWMPPGVQNLSSALYTDEVHPNDAGHRAIADAVLTVIGPYAPSMRLVENGYSVDNPPPAPSTMVTLDTVQTITGNKNFTGSLSQGGNAVVVTTDARLSDARTPTAHTHPVTQISATGTASSATYLRGDGTWTTPPTQDLSSYYSATNPPPTQPAPTNMVTTDTQQTISGVKTFAAITGFDGGALFRGNVATAIVAGFRVATDTQNRVGIQSNGVITFGDGATATDTVLFRVAPNALQTNGIFNAASIQDNGSRVYSVNNKVPVAGISATGTASATTYLRGDGTWATVAASGGTTGAKVTAAPSSMPPAAPAVGDLWVITNA